MIPDDNREALERLCRYGARPAFAHHRLAWTTDGRVSYKLIGPSGRKNRLGEAEASELSAISTAVVLRKQFGP